MPFTTTADAEAQVQQFLTDYDRQWRAAKPVFDERDPDDPRRAFRLWGELTVELTRTHAAVTDLGLSGSFGTPPEYGLEVERIIRSEGGGDTAYVLTEVFGSPVRMFHEYTLQTTPTGWGIRAIAQHFDDPTHPFLSPSEAETRRSACAPDAPLDGLPEPETLLDEVRNFTVREVTRPQDGQSERTQIEEIGSLVTRSGVLAVLDFGYENNAARPLARTVAPGSYPVDRVTAFGRNAAVRVRFADRMPVAWHPVSVSPGRGHVIGVDAGCICIVDYLGYSAMTRRDKAEAFDRFVAAPKPAASEVPLGEAARGIVLDSGYGDGGYPAYWGVDAHGEVVQLVVEFMVLVDQDDAGSLIHL